MKYRLSTRKLTITGAILIALLTGLGFIAFPQQGQTPGTLALQAPPFLSVAQADTTLPPAANPAANLAVPSVFTDTEIGIAAYFNANKTINLNVIESLLDTNETSPNATDYIIGSIAPESDTYSYSNNHAVHVYVQQNGWVMAYYRSSEPASYIIDWLGFTDGSAIKTKLELVLFEIGSAVNVGNPAISYYHFNFPNANRMMLIADEGVGDSFSVILPTDLMYEEISWVAGSRCMWHGGTRLGCTDDRGTFQTEFTLGIAHQFSLESGCCGAKKGGLAIVYKEQ